jgi:hypothetical protein
MAASVTGKVKVPLALELFGNFSSSGRPVLPKEVLERFRTEQEQEESGKLASTDKEEASEAEPTINSSNKDEAAGEQVGQQGLFCFQVCL